MMAAGAAATFGCGVRWLIVLDRQVNGVAAAVGDILFPTSTEVGMRSLDKRKRFKTLLDKYTTLSILGQTGDVRMVHTYIKLKRPLITEFNSGTAGTVADIVTNALYFIIMTNTSTAVPSYTARTRLRYTDI